MKKRTLLLSFAVLASLQLFAQTKTKSAFSWNDGAHKFIKNILLSQTSHVGSKTTLPAERLRSSDYDWQYFTFNEDDSIRFKYSGLHGSIFDFNEMKYNFPTTPYDYDVPMGGVSFYIPRSMNILCDTAYAWTQNKTTGHYSLSRSNYANYDANANLLSYYNINVDTTGNPDIRYENTFDASNRITANIWFAHPAATWDTSAARYFVYNSSGQLVQDSISSDSAGVWTRQTRYVYNYDPSGNLIVVTEFDWNPAASAWVNSINYMLGYYSTGNLQTVFVTEDTGKGMFPAFKDTLGYAAGYNYFNYYREDEFTDTGLVTAATIHKYVGSAGVPDSVSTSELIYFFTSSGVVAQTIKFDDYYYYDTYGNPVGKVGYIDLGTGFKYNSAQNFFYEGLTGVNNLPEQADILIYPNPATNAVNLKMSNVALGKDITINITNTLGQTIKTQSATAQSNMQVSISDLAPGTYLMYIKDSNGSLWRIQKLVKQ